MKPEPGWFVRMGDEVRGPYAIAQLQQLAEVDVITPATEAAASSAGPWEKLEAMAVAAVVFPPRRNLGFKAAEFTVDNRSSAAPVDLRDVIAAANAPALPPGANRTIARVTAAESGKTPDAANEVSAMVREVGRKEAEFAPPPPPPKPRRPSRRLVFVGVLALLGNAVLVAIPVAYGALGDDLSMSIIRAWAVMFNGGLAVLYCSMPKE